MTTATAETIIGFTPHTAQAICPMCGARLYAVGADPRGSLVAAGELHDRECADLKAAAALIRARE